MVGNNGLATEPKLGLRERNKADKLRRIKAAAQELFSKKGYEQTTTREIADLADVSIGTIFAYAHDKADLVCLMAIDRQESRFARGFRSCDPDDSLLDQLITIYAPMFKETIKNVALARILIKEMVAYKDRQRTDDWIQSQITKLLVRALERGEITLDEDAGYVARIVHFAYLSEMRHWVMRDKPMESDGVGNLRRTLTWLLRSPGRC